MDYRKIMHIKPITLTISFVLVACMYNIYDLWGNWSNSSFLTGYICGLPLITCYFANNKIRILLFSLGILSLLLMMFDLASHYERDRLFFVGLSLGAISGWFPAYWLMRERISAFLSEAAYSEGYEKLGAYFKANINKN